MNKRPNLNLSKLLSISTIRENINEFMADAKSSVEKGELFGVLRYLFE